MAKIQLRFGLHHRAKVQRTEDGIRGNRQDVVGIAAEY